MSGPVSEAVEDYVQWVQRTGLAPSSAKVYIRHCRAFAAWADAHPPDEYAECISDANVREFAVRDYKRKMIVTDKLAPTTWATVRASLSNFFMWSGVGRVTGSTADVAKSGKVGLGEADLRKVMRQACRNGPRDEAIVQLLYGTAIRAEECAALDVDDVKITDKTGVLSVRYGKGGRSRTVGINADVRPAIRRWLEARPATEDPALFVARTGRRLSKRGIERRLEEISKQTGVHVHPHALRHTHGRRFVESGGDLVVLQQNLGHKNIATTAVYANPTDEDRFEAVERVRMDW